MMHLLAAFTLAIPGLFSVESIEGLDETHAIALVPRVKNGPVCLWAVSENEIQCRQPGGAVDAAALPGGGIKVFDVADADSDGRFEAVVLTGEAVWLVQPGAEIGPQKAFGHAGLAGLSLESSWSPNRPDSMVMAVEIEGEPALCLPGIETYALRRLDGAPIRDLPTTQEDVFATTSMRRAWAYLAPPGVQGLHIYMHRRTLFHVNPPPELPLPVGSPPVPDWEWEGLLETGHDYITFPLRKDELLPRIIVTWPPDPREKSRVAILEDQDTEFDPKTLRPYPGRLMMGSHQWPDFNGDGCMDLLLWTVPNFPTTPTAAAKAAASASWGLRATVHCYDPEKGRHDVRPSAHFDLEIPLLWFMGFPLERFALDDVNADGLTDCLWSTAPDSFEVWLARPDGRFGDSPDFQHTFGEPLNEAAPQVFAMAVGPAHVVLRGEGKVYWLRPNG